MRIALYLVLAASLLSHAQAQHSERILIPVAYTGPGEHGSFWVTSIAAINRSADEWGTPGVTFTFVCSIPPGCMTDALPPGLTASLLGHDTYLHAPGGMLLYVPPEVSVWARLGTLARYQYGGTELPTPHEREFRTRPMLFPSVAIGHPPVRLLLRLYGIDVTNPLTVRVRLLQRWETPLPPTAEVTLQLPAGGTEGEVFPAYVQLDLRSVFGRHGILVADIEVIADVPPGGAAKLWGMVSMTSNDTNEVTIVSPK